MLAGPVLIASLTTTLVAGIQENPAVPPDVKQQADTQLSSGVPFLFDADLESALEDAGVTGNAASASLDENAAARLRARQTALAVIAIVAAAALFFSRTIPTRQPGSQVADTERGPRIRTTLPRKGLPRGWVRSRGTGRPAARPRSRRCSCRH